MTNDGPDRSPTRFPTVVVGFEGSPDSVRALRWATDEACRRAAVLRIVYAYQTVGGPGIAAKLDRQARAVLEAAVAEASRLAPGLTVCPDLARDEDASRALLCRAADADLLVVGCRGLGGFTGLLVGSVSDQCARHSPCPVAIVRGHATAADPR